MQLCRRRIGFTLIELLVVIAIIAILAAILFPVFLAAQASARKGKCQSHQKQLVAALHAYADDHSGSLPFIQFLTYHDFGGSLAGYPWIHMVRLYQPYVKNYDIILCTESYKEQWYPYGSRKQGFAYNEILCGPLNAKARIPVQIRDKADVYFFSKREGRPMGSIKYASKTPAFFCAVAKHHAPGDYGPNGWGWEPEDIIDRNRMLNRHSGGINYGFLDGHVRWAKPAGGWFLMTLDGIDYDGNGTVGSADFMR
mgnify:CR=1 FL=1